MFCISRRAFLRFTFHWYFHCSNWKYQKYSISQNVDIFHFIDNGFFMKNHIRKKRQNSPETRYYCWYFPLKLEHVYMRPEVNSNQFEISNGFEKWLCLHCNFTKANTEISKPFEKFFHCVNFPGHSKKCPNDGFKLMQTQRRTIRSETIFGNWKFFKNDEKCILFQKALFVLKIFKFLSWLLGHASKRLD